MLETSGAGRTGRLDAIVYRAGGSRPFYVSEHATSIARGRDFHACIDNLSQQVRDDVAAGIYPVPEKSIVRTFVTSVEAPLGLLDRPVRQAFACRVDELEDYAGRRSFEAQCPTNYLSESGSTVAEAIKGLGDVLSARYEGESIADLMRELPKRPMMTSFDLSGKGRARWANAAIARAGGRYEARALDAPVSVTGSSPLDALESLERRLRARGLYKAVATSGEPAFCALDVPLHLREHTVTRRFLVSVSRFNGRAAPSYSAYAPQVGVAVRSSSFTGAVDAIGDAIALELRGRPEGDLRRAFKEPVILATARLSIK